MTNNERYNVIQNMECRGTYLFECPECGDGRPIVAVFTQDGVNYDEYQPCPDHPEGDWVVPSSHTPLAEDEDEDEEEEEEEEEEVLNQLLHELIQCLLQIEADNKSCPVCGLGWALEHSPHCALEKAGIALHERTHKP